MLRFTLSQGQSLTCLCITGRRSNSKKSLAELLCRCSQAHSTLTQREPGLHAQATRRADDSRTVTDKLEERRDSGSKASSSRAKSAAPHIPVLLDEVLACFRDQQLRVFVDGTLGAGGHSAAIVAEHPELQTLIGIDMDPTAHETAKQRISKAAQTGSGLMSMEKVRQVQGNFGHLRGILEAELGCSPDGSVDGLLLDLGMSSMQLDTAVRGFSHAKEGPLDMRMGPDARRSAEEIVNTWSEFALRDLLHKNGELHDSWKFARDIVRAREESQIRTTGQLLAALGLSLDNRGSLKALLFQALRIAVNDELDALERVLPDAISALAPGGRLAVISFHSLEDRMVKWAFLRAAGRPIPGQETCRILTLKPLTPGKEEAKRNPRARSAKLRILEKLRTPVGSPVDNSWI